MAKVEKSQLHLALDHAYLACGGSASFAAYCHFQPGWLVGYDGVIAAGTRVNEQLPIAPHTELFRAAIARAGNPYSLTVKADGSLSVSGNTVRAPVKCLPNTAIPNVMPDVPLGPCNDALRRAIIDAGRIVASRTDTVIPSSVLLREQSCVATDGGTILEAWHGNGIPCHVLLPKEFAEALSKVKAMPTHCGWGDGTFTVWFGADQWIRTNTYDPAGYPDTDILFSQFMAHCTEYRPVPEALLQAIETLKPFRTAATMWIEDYGLNTGPKSTGAYIAFEHFLRNPCEYPTEGLKMAAMHGKHMSFCSTGAYWYGENVRGITALSNEL